MTVLAPACSPTSSLLPLLLLLLSPGLRGTSDCYFDYSPVSSTFHCSISKLTEYLIKDYPVTLASNLQDEKYCKALWSLFLAQGWMERLKTVAGSELQQLLEAVNTEIHFVTSCAFQDISAQLLTLRSYIGKDCKNFSRCLEVQCQPDPTLLPPRSPGALGATELPDPGSPQLLLLLLIPVTLGLPAVAWCLSWRRSRKRRRRRRRTAHPAELVPPASCPQDVTPLQS